MDAPRNADLSVQYRGDPAKLFPLALGTGLLAVVTLGIYRFWAKARIRRFVWSHIRVGDDALEFTGMSYGVPLSLIAVPVVVRTTENMLRLVPGSLREAAFALGPSKNQFFVSIEHCAFKRCPSWENPKRSDWSVLRPPHGPKTIGMKLQQKLLLETAQFC